MQCKVINSLYHTINSIKLRQKEPKILQGITTLNQSDIEFIDVLNLNPHQNATALAKLLNISRGAVSQSLGRLEKLGIIERVPVKGNLKEKIIQLTDLGKEIKKEKDLQHQQANQQMCSFLRGLKTNQLEAIMMFLDKVHTLDISRFDCLEHHCAIEEKGEQHA
ncbi:MAG: winged helix-turn-helix transcriptional regulator [Bacillota bacterium]|jgi:DNA-binding MarR family transcriptional regulator|nr:winged helix-turn-helix transcriptional regulator [Bacillota bacterium]NLL26096.1 winged helix-turn-helix transcriptional regulator [Erysipelotrichia bacterium]